MEAPLDLDLDIIKMIHFDQFLAENFIRCFFRYYPKLSNYVKDVYLDIYKESNLLKIKDTSYN